MEHALARLRQAIAGNRTPRMPPVAATRPAAGPTDASGGRPGTIAVTVARDPGNARFCVCGMGLAACGLHRRALGRRCCQQCAHGCVGSGWDPPTA